MANIGKKTKGIGESKAEQAKASAALVVANGAKNNSDLVHADDRELNALLTRAAQFGVLLDNDPEFQSDAAEIVRAKEIDDYKAIAMLKHIDRSLDSDQRALLPWPGSTKAEAEARQTKGSNLPLLYDKPKASGGRAKVETFYGYMIENTKLGKQAREEIATIQAEIDRAKVEPNKARLPGNIEADMRKATVKFNNLLAALRTAAQVRLLIEDIKTRCPSVVIEWVREQVEDEDAIPADADLTLLNVSEAGDVVHSPACLNIWTRPVDPRLTSQSMAKAKRYSIGSFKRWKVTRAIEIAKKDGRTRVTVDDLIASPKPVPSANNQPSTQAQKDARYKVTSITEFDTSVGENVAYAQGSNPVEQAQRLASLQGRIKDDDATADAYYRMFVLLRSAGIEHPAVLERINKYREGLAKSGVA